MFGDAITKVTLPIGFGFEKAATQAAADANSINIIRRRVENQSATIDMIAATAKTSESTAKLAQDRLQETEKIIDSLHQVVAQADITLKRLQQSAQVTTFIADAEDDDRSALNELLRVSQDPSNPDAQRAQAAWNTITTGAYTGIQLIFPVPWNKGIDPTKLDLEQLKTGYMEAKTQLLQVGLLQYIAGRSDFSKMAKAEFFLAVYKDSKSIKNAAYAAHQFYDITKGDLPIFQVELATAWWSMHRQEFQGK